jgi:Ribbon-helix-helix protein, copG family
VRTTLSLDDDVVEALREHARERRLSLGAAVSELTRKGLAAVPRVGVRKGIPVVQADVGTAVITLAKTLAAEDDW